MSISGYRFDMRSAYDAGAKRHPQVEILEFFPDARDIEANTISECFVFNAEERSGLPAYFSKLKEPWVSSSDVYRAKVALEEIHRRMALRTAQLSDGLLAAFAKTHRRMGLTTRTDERGRYCQFPVDDEWGTEVKPETLELFSGIADEYFAACGIAPEECMVVSWVDGMTVRVEYDLRPEEWR